MKKKDKAELVYEKMYEKFPNARCELHYESPFQLLVSTVLSAQTTDISVNNTMDEFYKQYPDRESFLTLTQEEIAQKIQKLGLYKNKSKSIYKLVRELGDLYEGEVPKNLDELVKLSGVGRKTASVVLIEAFDIPAIPVDTHVKRLSNRLGLSKESSPDRISDDLMKLFPKNKWKKTHHLFIIYGRNICKSRNPKCKLCEMRDICDYYKKMQNSNIK